MFRRKSAWVVVLAGVLGASACRNDMHNQPRYKTFAATDFFGDGRSERPTIEDTVARGQLHLDEARYTGKVNGKDVDYFPIQITKADLERGQERFNIYCSPCHGRLGNGHGMIVGRGLRQPPNYTDPRLMDAPVGHFFDVMTNGYGAMYSYASRVANDDRWRIAAYIRALQLSQNAPPDLARQQQTRNLRTGQGGPAGGMK
ncbi:MAG: cytochrome c [Acidobacteriaceae bacterium]|nr:cytochrome c [Acidobacteriaceae bacterium]MBV8570171.1 cytochrome c [Acidobacteriaceae bacterium]